jgi:hypothetical protein
MSASELLAAWVVPPAGWKKMYSLSSLISPKNGGSNCPLYPSEFIEFEEMGLIMHAALTAHHTPTMMSHVGTSVLGNCCFEYLGDLLGTISNEVI